MKVKELMDSLKGDCYRFRVHYPEEWEFGLITGATFFGKRGLVLQHGEDDVSSFTLNPSWLSCEARRSVASWSRFTWSREDGRGE